MNSNCSFKENISGDFYERITLQISPVYSLKNEYINPNVFLIMWLLKFEVDFKIFLNFTITHSLSKTFLTISKKQKIPKTLFLAKFKKKKTEKPKTPSLLVFEQNKFEVPVFWPSQMGSQIFYMLLLCNICSLFCIFNCILC